MVSTAIRRLVELTRTGPSSQTRRDQALAKRLHTLFEETAPVDGVRNIHFYVINGSVTVLGHIDDPERRAFFLSIIEQVPGVQAVIDQLLPADARCTPQPDARESADA